MRADCLEKLLVALQKHPECGIAHCNLQMIDDLGDPIDGIWEDWDAVKYFGGLMTQSHVRPKGHDAVIACAFYTPYWSITQLLFRRSLLEKTGLFDGKWASYGDLAWQMRATLNTGTVHVPEKLATWRIHPAQASQLEKAKQDRREGLFVSMVDEFLDYSRRVRLPDKGGLSASMRRYMVVKMWMEHPWKDLSRLKKAGVLLKRFVTEPRATLHFLRALKARKNGQSEWAYVDVKRDIERSGVEQPRNLG
jgi:hypothetical protein